MLWILHKAATLAEVASAVIVDYVALHLITTWNGRLANRRRMNSIEATEYVPRDCVEPLGKTYLGRLATGASAAHPGFAYTYIRGDHVRVIFQRRAR